MKNRYLVFFSTIALSGCSTMSVDQMRARPPSASYTSQLSPTDFSECVVSAFNSSARGFEMIQFNGAKSYKQGARITITAETNSPTYILDVVVSGQGSFIEERTTLGEGKIGGYLERFRSFTKSCL